METVLLAFAFLVCMFVTLHGVLASQRELPWRERLWVFLFGAAGAAGVVRSFFRLYGYL